MDTPRLLPGIYLNFIYLCEDWGLRWGCMGQWRQGNLSIRLWLLECGTSEASSGRGTSDGRLTFCAPPWCVKGVCDRGTLAAPLGAKRSAWANSLLLQFLAGLLSACLSGFPRCHLSGLWVPLGRWLWCLAFSMCSWRPMLRASGSPWPVEGGVRDRTCQRQWVTFYLWCQEEALLNWGSHELLEGDYRYRYIFFLIYLF